MVRVNGITSVMTFPSSGGARRRWRPLRRRRTPVHLRPGGAHPHRRLDLGRHGDRSHRGHAPDLPHARRTRRTRRRRCPDAVLELIPGGAGATGFTAAKRTYEQQVAKINEFFEQARQYQKERAAKAPGFKPVLKMEAMIPVLEGKVPLAVSAARASVIHDAIAFAEKQKIKIVILQPRDIAKAGPELKAKNIPVILGRVLALPEQEDDPYDGAFTQPAEAYKAGVKFAFGTFNNEFVRNLPYQAATAVAFGLPYEEALKAVTINAAEIWGHADDIGSVEKGKVGRPDGHHRRPAVKLHPGEVPVHQRQRSPAGQQADPPLRKVHVAPVSAWGSQSWLQPPFRRPA